MHRAQDWPAAYPGDLLGHLRSLAVLAARVGRPAAFTDAARELGVDESVLRRRVSTLEAALGARVVDGRGAAMRLTAEGRLALGVAERVRGALSDLAAPAVSRFSIGCTGAIANEVLPSIVARLCRESPDLVVHVQRTGAVETLARVQDGRLDLGVVRSAVAPPAVESRFVSEDRLHLAVPERHPLARGALRPEAMAAHPIITYRPSSATRARVMRVLGPLGATARIEVEGKSVALRYVELGLGIAFVSALPAQVVAARRLVLRDVTRWFEPTSFWAVWRKGAALRPWARQAIEALAAAARR